MTLTRGLEERLTPHEGARFLSSSQGRSRQSGTSCSELVETRLELSHKPSEASALPSPLFPGPSPKEVTSWERSEQGLSVAKTGLVEQEDTEGQQGQGKGALGGSLRVAPRPRVAGRAGVWAERRRALGSGPGRPPGRAAPVSRLPGGRARASCWEVSGAAFSHSLGR